MLKPILSDWELEEIPRAKKFADPTTVEIEVTHVTGFDYRLRARQVGGILLKLGDKIEYKGMALYVTNTIIQHGPGDFDKVTVEAEGGTVDPNKEILHKLFHGGNQPHHLADRSGGIATMPTREP